MSANAQKTGLLVIRSKCLRDRITINVGGENIEEEDHQRILGVVVNNRLTWSDHVYGKGALLQGVNRRVGMLKRIVGYVPPKSLSQIANALVSSKVRYGISIYGDVRTEAQEPLTASSKDLQVAMNKAMRVILGCRLSDRVPISDLVTRSGLPTVNRMAAEEKIMLMWKAINDPQCPLSQLVKPEAANGKNLRSNSRGDVKLRSRSTLGQRNFPEAASRVWNKTGLSIRSQVKKSMAKRLIKKFTQSLPL